MCSDNVLLNIYRIMLVYLGKKGVTAMRGGGMTGVWLARLL